MTNDPSEVTSQNTTQNEQNKAIHNDQKCCAISEDKGCCPTDEN